MNNIGLIEEYVINPVQEAYSKYLEPVVDEATKPLVDAVDEFTKTEAYNTYLLPMAQGFEMAASDAASAVTDTIAAAFTSEDFSEFWSKVNKAWDFEARAEERISESEAEDLLLDNPSPEQAVDILTRVDLPEQGEMTAAMAEAAAHAADELESASDADLAETYVKVLVDLAAKGYEGMEDVLSQILGTYGYQALKEAGWRLEQVDKEQIIQDAARAMMVAHYTDKQGENFALSALLSLMKLEMAKDKDLDHYLRGSQIASGLVAGCLPATVNALADMLGIPIGSSWTTKTIRGSVWYVIDAGSYRVCVAALPVEGFDVRVFKSRSSDVTIIDEASRIAPRKVRAAVSSVLGWAYNSTVHEYIEDALRSDIDWKQLLPVLLRLLRAPGEERDTPEPTPEEPVDETDITLFQAGGAVEDESKRDKRSPDDEQILTSFLRGQASRAISARPAARDSAQREQKKVL